METTHKWKPRSEPKHEACRRLEEDGRYETFRDRQRQIRESERNITKDAAFYRALAEFPPDGETVEVVVPVPPEPQLADDGIDLTQEFQSKSSNVQQDTRWVYENLAGYMDAESMQRDRPKEAHAKMREIELTAPNSGAVGLLRSAASNSNKFMLETVPKLLMSKQEDEVDPADRKRDADLRLLLKHHEDKEWNICPHCGGDMTQA